MKHAQSAVGVGLAATPMDLQTPPILRACGPAWHGQTLVETWSGLSFWSLHAYHYRAQLRVGSTVLELRPGCVTVLPAGMDLEYRFRGPSHHLYAHFVPAGQQEPIWELPMMMQLPAAAFRRFNQDFMEMANWHVDQPARAAARLWDLLWRLARPVTQVLRQHPLVRAATAMMIQRLSEPALRIDDVAAELGVSQAHLTRVFRTELGSTPRQVLRQRRAQWARHLLLHTHNPAKSIARAVGLHDLQQLNKLLRREWGKSPRQIRQRG